MEKGKYKDLVKGVILLGFADSFGCQMNFLKTQNIDPMENAKELIKNNKGYEFITSIWLCHAGVLQKTADSYINCFSENSELSKALPLRKGKDLFYYQNINVPILGVISDTDNWNEMLGVDTINLLKQENSNAEIPQLPAMDADLPEERKQEFLGLANETESEEEKGLNDNMTNDTINNPE